MYCLLWLCSAFSVEGSDSNTYEYNPCYPFTDEGCKDVAVSIINYYYITIMYVCM